jgi:Flp pilus assembly protein TadD
MTHIPLARRPFRVLAASIVVASVLAAAGSATAQGSAANPRVAAARALDRGNHAEVHALLMGLDDTPRPCCAPAPTWRWGSMPRRRRSSSRRPENPIGDAAVELGILQRMLGRREALRTLSIILCATSWRPRRPTTCARPRGAALRRFRTRTGSFVRPTRRRPPTSPSTWRGANCSSKRTNAAKRRGRSRRRCAPRRNIPTPSWARARTVSEDNPPLAKKLAAQVLSINEKHTGARVLLAELALDETKRPEAAAEVEAALAVNPNHFEALSLKAAIAWLDKRTDDYTATTGALMKLNPTYGEVYRVVGGVAARQYRFEDAAELARRAITVDRENVRAYADLGAHLMRTETNAAPAGRSKRRSVPIRFDRVTYNLLALLDTLDGFRDHPRRRPCSGCIPTKRR